MNIGKELVRVAKTILCASINRDSDFWGSVYLDSFPGRKWKEYPINENRFRYLVSQFMSQLEKLIKTADNKRFFYSSIQWKLDGHAVIAVVKMEENGKKENINLFFGSEGNDAGRVYVDGSYQMGRGKQMKDVADEIIRDFEQIH